MLEPNIFVRRRPIDADGISRWDKKAGLRGQEETRRGLEADL